MNYRGKTYKTIGEVFNEALRLARADSYEAKEFFKEYVNWISMQNHYSWDKATEIAKSNLGYFAGYFDEEVCDIIYKTYQCSHPILEISHFLYHQKKHIRRDLKLVKNLNKGFGNTSLVVREDKILNQDDGSDWFNSNIPD